MNEIIKSIEATQLRATHEFSVGDTVRVHKRETEREFRSSRVLF